MILRVALLAMTQCHLLLLRSAIATLPSYAIRAEFQQQQQEQQQQEQQQHGIINIIRMGVACCQSIFVIVWGTIFF